MQNQLWSSENIVHLSVPTILSFMKDKNLSAFLARYPTSQTELRQTSIYICIVLTLHWPTLHRTISRFVIGNKRSHNELFRTQVVCMSNSCNSVLDLLKQTTESSTS